MGRGKRTLKTYLALATACAVFVAAISAGPASAAGGVPDRSASGKSRAKNIIILISDGMGYNHMLAADFYEAGKAGVQVYEHYPVAYAMSTYPGSTSSTPDPGLLFPGSYDPALAWTSFPYVTLNYTDSAAAGTTLASGVKTYNNAIGMDVNGVPVESILERAESLGKATGVVTTVEFTHATPAAFAAHNLSRNNYQAIGEQMIDRSAVDVIMGAGHPWFDNSGAAKASPNTYQYVGGVATWNALKAGTAGADADRDGVADPWTLIESRADFQSLTSGPTPDRVVGVAQVYTTLQQVRAGDAYADAFAVPRTASVPTLEEMVRGALNVLDNDPDGFFMMVEGGAVDWAAHANQSGRTIEEQLDFNAAAEAVDEWVREHSNWGETLVIVTADHETSYLLGPGSGPTSDPMWQPILNNGAGQMPGMWWPQWGNHTNSLVPFFAKGDAARLARHYADQIDPIHGRYLDNSEVSALMLQAIGD